MPPTVASLVVYPIKSCGGLELSQCEVLPTGLRGDRLYMLVDENGRFITGRAEPRLVLVRPTAGEDSTTFRFEAPALSPLHLPKAPHESDGSQVPTNAQIWKDSVPVLRHDEGSAWFCDYLKRRVTLCFLKPQVPRQVTHQDAQPGDIVSLADGFPLLLTAQASLDDLNQRLPSPISMRRFRPNVVLVGAPPYDEDSYTKLSIGELEFRAPKLCDRCVFITVDPDTGERTPEPLKTLAKYRRWNKAVWFGTNLLPDKTGRLSVGDVLQVLKRRPPPAPHPTASSSSQRQ